MCNACINIYIYIYMYTHTYIYIYIYIYDIDMCIIINNTFIWYLLGARRPASDTAGGSWA